MIIDVEKFFVLRDQLPVVDVRSEGEYDSGHVEGSVNIPLLKNDERVIVGTTYKTHGQQEAIRTGFRLVGPRLAELIQHAEKQGDEFIVHCWRGGMRSTNFCQFVGMAGIKTHQLAGGYKAYRRFALSSYKQPFNLIVIAGYTGSGKSELLHALKAAGEQVIDLEGLANHKGSVFGGLKMPAQPTTEQFQNDLFEVIRKFDLSKRIWIEDESIAVGKIFLPIDLWAKMSVSPIVVVDVEKHRRISRLVAEYAQSDHERFLTAMQGITKKLGGQHYKAARECVLADDWHGAIDLILNYYDKAYTNGLEKKSQRVKLRLSWEDSDSSLLAQQLKAIADKI